MCAAAVVLALLGFMFSLTAMYSALVEARDSERWRNMHDHPSNRNRRPLGPDDDPDWP